jgi:hypothetical protein
MDIELAAAYAVVQALHMSANLHISLTCPLKTVSRTHRTMDIHVSGSVKYC